ncbi:hypothetical protein H2248_007909 [Termitomyces sp. 'cryptogamus']|nr:hypothetical protein H2248_007909 [Termitomyces sp. 'cryptogamus']
MLRLNEDKAHEKISVDNVTVHCPPYDTLQPVLKSHIRPHYVIFNLVMKLRDAKANIMELTKDREHLNRSLLNDYESIYDKWMYAQVPSSFKGNKTRTDKDNNSVVDEGDGGRSAASSHVRDDAGSNGGYSGRISGELGGRNTGRPQIGRGSRTDTSIRYQTRSEVRNSKNNSMRVDKTEF